MTTLEKVVGNLDRYVKREREELSVPDGSSKRRHISNENGQMTGNKMQEEGEEDHFRAGSIIRVHVKNFTTYSFAEFHLSPTLNMIIGPNGSGKSTLVAAICLGLGGKIELIKRQDMKSMIKTGEVQSSIEIEVKNLDNKPNYVIKRDFNEKKSFYFINNRTSTEKEVRKVCKELNIQLDNLCSFLPQERVAEFARLSPEKLLIEVERAVGSGELLKNHETLMEIDTRKVEIDTKVENLETRLEELYSRRERLEEEARKFEEYQRKATDLENHQKLLPYAIYQDQKARIAHLKTEREAAKKRLEEFNDSSKPFQDAIKKFSTVAAGLKQRETGVNLEKEKVHSDIDAIKAKITKYTEQIRELAAKKQALVERASKKKEELKKTQEERHKYEQHVASLVVPTDDELNNLRALRDQKFDEKNELGENDSTSEYHHMKQQVKRYEEQANSLKSQLDSRDKIGVLDQNGGNNRLMRDTKDTTLFLRKNTDFKGMYYEPPVICCDVTDKSYGRYLEKCVDNNTLLAFTTATRDAYETISRTVFDHKKSNVPFRYTSNNSDNRSRYSQDELHHLGFDGYMSDFVTGPDTVIKMLCEQSKIHLIPVSIRPLTPDQVDRLVSPTSKGDIRFMKFIAGDVYYQVYRSNYGRRETSYNTENIHPSSRFFGGTGMSEERKREVTNEIQEVLARRKDLIADIESLAVSIKESNAKREELDKEFEEIKLELRAKQETKKTYLTSKNRLEKLTARIAVLDAESNKSFEAEIAKVNQLTTLRLRKKLNSITDLSNSISQSNALSVDLSKAKLELLQEENKIVSLCDLLNNLESQKQRLVEEYQAAKQKYLEAKNTDFSENLRRQTAEYSQEERETLGELVSDYISRNELTEVIITEKINALRSDLELSSTADRSSLQELQRHLQEITNGETILPRLKKEKLDIEERIKTIRDVWEPELNQLIEGISRQFQERFTAVASAGYVQVKEEERFKDWRLEIMVKFRDNEDYKVLDSHSQSGGERAVSTIFFMMCLQGLTDAPFRIVDEINQGMDPRNEKLAHKHLVHTSCENSTSQYFLVTPKLLTGLYYHPKMRIHCICTGFVPKSTESGRGLMDFVRKF